MVTMVFQFLDNDGNDANEVLYPSNNNIQRSSLR